jgi:thioredoxin 1
MSEPTRDEVGRWPGTAVLEFGASWCPICQGARPSIDRALASHPGLRHTWVEDGPGRPLGRSFRVKLWPTLVLLRDGVEVARVVRPGSEDEVRAFLAPAAPQDGKTSEESP